MSNQDLNQAAPKRSGFPAFAALVVVALIAVLLVWFRTPTIQVPSFNDEDTLITQQCANAGPSRFAAPRAWPGQDVSGDANMIPFSLQVMKNDLESIQAGLACSQARDAHTNTLIVTTFAASTAILLGYVGLTRRRIEASR